MKPLMKALLLVAAPTLAMAPPSQIVKSDNNEPSCGGRHYDLVTVPDGGSPYVELVADGVSGPFLLDYGATKSSLSRATFAASNGAIASLSIPGYTRRFFELKRYAKQAQPAQGQIGVIGVDILSTLTVELSGNTAFLGEQPCQAGQLRARRLIPIAQKGFFSSRPSTEGKLPNVPVVFVRLGEIRTWAQIDTGYEDFVYAHSVDINQVCFEQLIKSNVKLNRIGDIQVSTCEGRETRQVYTSNDVPLSIETDQGTPVLHARAFNLILKPPNGCGGIAALATPAAQLGASFLQTFGTIVFDPRSETVWVEGDRQ